MNSDYTTTTLRFVVVMLSILSSAIYVSCGSSTSDKVEYGMDGVYRLQKGEKQGVTTKDNIKEYEITCVPDSISIPVNVLIDGSTYKLFVAFATSQLSTSEYMRMMGTKKGFLVLDEQLSKQPKRYFYKSNNRFVAQYWSASTVPGMQEVFSFISADSTITAKLYNDTSTLQQRISK